MNNTKIAFIGGGNITRAFVTGLIAFNYSPDCIWVSDPSQDHLDFLHQTFGVHTCKNNIEAVEEADILVLAVKPTVIPNVCNEIKGIIKKTPKLIISVAIGATTALMQQWLDHNQQPLIYAMPNTAAAIGSGATGLYANAWVTPEQKNIAEALFRSVGVTLWVNNESDINIVCALSGSGPAYIFLMMEALQKAGTAFGLEAKTAQLLTDQMVLGAAKMALEAGKPVEQLRQAVTSPQGTTEAALKVLQEGNLMLLIEKTIAAAITRAEQITLSLSQKDPD